MGVRSPVDVVAPLSTWAEASSEWDGAYVPRPLWWSRVCLEGSGQCHHRDGRSCWWSRGRCSAWRRLWGLGVVRRHGVRAGRCNGRRAWRIMGGRYDWPFHHDRVLVRASTRRPGGYSRSWVIHLDNAPPSLAVILVLTGMAVAQAPLVWWNWHPESTPRRLRESPHWGTGLNGYLAAGGTAAALIVWPLVLFGWGMYPDLAQVSAHRSGSGYGRGASRRSSRSGSAAVIVCWPAWM